MSDANKFPFEGFISPKSEGEGDFDTKGLGSIVFEVVDVALMLLPLFVRIRGIDLGSKAGTKAVGMDLSGEYSTLLDKFIMLATAFGSFLKLSTCCKYLIPQLSHKLVLWKQQK